MTPKILYWKHHIDNCNCAQFFEFVGSFNGRSLFIKVHKSYVLARSITIRQVTAMSRLMHWLQASCKHRVWPLWVFQRDDAGNKRHMFFNLLVRFGDYMNDMLARHGTDCRFLSCMFPKLRSCDRAITRKALVHHYSLSEHTPSDANSGE